MNKLKSIILLSTVATFSVASLPVFAKALVPQYIGGQKKCDGNQVYVNGKCQDHCPFTYAKTVDGGKYICKEDF